MCVRERTCAWLHLMPRSCCAAYRGGAASWLVRLAPAFEVGISMGMIVHEQRCKVLVQLQQLWTALPRPTCLLFLASG